MSFSLNTYTDLDYTRDTIVKQALLIQQHSTDNSSTDAHCMCVEEKHLILMEGLAEEGSTIATNKQEKRFYSNLASTMRNIRKAIVNEEFNLGEAKKVHVLTSCQDRVRECMESGHTLRHCKALFPCN